jgi:hypothetical protein
MKSNAMTKCTKWLITYTGFAFVFGFMFCLMYKGYLWIPQKIQNTLYTTQFGDVYGRFQFVGSYLYVIILNRVDSFDGFFRLLFGSRFQRLA